MTGNPTGKNPLCTPRCRWVDNISTLELKYYKLSLEILKTVFMGFISIKEYVFIVLKLLILIRTRLKCIRSGLASHVPRIEEGRSAFKILTGTPTEKRPLGRPRRRWEDNIRMDLK